MVVTSPSPSSELEPSKNELDVLKGQFLASLNHMRLPRTPLSGIYGDGGSAVETNLDSEQCEYVNAARLCAESLFEILNATLEYSSLEAGQFRQWMTANSFSRRCWIRGVEPAPATRPGEGTFPAVF